MEKTPTPNDRIIVKKTARSPKCARCRNHGFIVPLKGHSGKCQFRPCLCWKCSLIAERTKILQSQRQAKTESPSAKRAADPAKHSDDGTALSEADKPSANGENDKPNSRKESVIKAPVQRAVADDKTYTELRAPLAGTVNTSEIHTERKTPAGLSAPDHNRGDSSHFPGEYLATEAVPRNMYGGGMLAMPLSWYLHYPDGYMCPAVLVSLRPPAPGVFTEPTGFLPPPPAALSHPLDTCKSQVCVSHYSPYPPYPGVRDEHEPRLYHHPLSHVDGGQGAPKIPPQTERLSESQVVYIEETDGGPVISLSSKNTQ